MQIMSGTRDGFSNAFTNFVNFVTERWGGLVVGGEGGDPKEERREGERERRGESGEEGGERFWGEGRSACGCFVLFCFVEFFGGEEREEKLKKHHLQQQQHTYL